VGRHETSAFNRGRVVAFADRLDAPSAEKAQERKLIQAFEATPGVDHGSVRMLFNPAAISFSFAERMAKQQNILAAAESGLKSGTCFALTRSMNKP
jgi:hypothetical protein